MSTIKERYFDILTNGANLAELCNLTAEYVKNPVALELATHTIIAKSHDYSQYLLDEFTAGHEKATEEELKEIADRMQELLHEGKAIKRLWPYLKHKHVNCGCFHRNNLIAVIDCPIVGNFDESDLSVIEMASSIFVIALGLNSYITLNFIYPMQNYLIGLLKNEIDEQYQQHNYYGLILETVKSFRIIWAKPENKSRTTSMRNMVTTFCKRQTNWWNIDFDDGFAILIDAEQSSAIEQFGKSCAPYCPVCVSDTFYELKKAGEQLELAQTTLRLAAFEENDSPIIFVDQYKPIIAYLYSNRSSNLDVFNNFTITAIKEYDDKNSTDYLRTLRIWLFYNRDCDRVSTKLHVHRNTVFYRIKRITEMFDLDLNDIRTITGLYLSLFIQV